MLRIIIYNETRDMNNSNPFIYLSHREVRELRWQVTWDSPGRRPAVVDPGGGARSQPPAKGAAAQGVRERERERERERKRERRGSHLLERARARRRFRRRGGGERERERSERCVGGLWGKERWAVPVCFKSWALQSKLGLDALCPLYGPSPSQPTPGDWAMKLS